MHGNAQQTVGELAMQRELAECEFIKVTRHPITVSDPRITKNFYLQKCAPDLYSYWG
jgi:hypothetical protein